MRHRVNFRLGACVALCALAAGLSPAWGQSATILVAWKGDDPAPFDGDGDSPYTDLQEAVNDATTAAINGNRQVLLLIYEDPDGDPWTVADNNLPLTIDAEANIRIIGVAADPNSGGPFDIVLQGNGGAPVITIDGAGADGRTDRLVIDGISIRGGTDGVLITGDSAAANDSPMRPTLSRCYIRGNAGAGVRIEAQRGAALASGESGFENGPLLANCSIAENGAEGVRVGNGIPTPGFFADILHCSILMNGSEGVYVETGCNARVRNTLVYRNATGGLVWQSNPVIDPDNGPVAGGTPVTISGLNFSEGGATRVYFGPPAKNGTEAASYSGTSETEIECTTPPAWTGAPGPVDVYIVRGDTGQHVICNGFTYTQAVVTAPVVSQVLPEWGPVAGGNWVDIYGSGFNPDVAIRFGSNPSTHVVWLASGHVRAKAPAALAPGKVEVFAQNPGGPSSIDTDPDDYEYRSIGVEGPSITQISPNYYRNTQGSGASPGDGALADVVGFNFQDGCIVKIGGIVCAYESMSVVLDRAPLQQLVNVQIPVSEFGGGGSYDVEVVNPDGQRDILPNGFTYYASGIPSIEPEESQNLAWRISNFVERGTGGERTLRGSGFDYQVDVIVDPAGVNYLFQDDVQPVAQREITMTFPAQTDTDFGLPANQSVVPIEVRNAEAILGNDSTAVDGSATTNIVYSEPRVVQTPVAGAIYYEVVSLSQIAPTGSTDRLQMQVLNWRDDMVILVGGQTATNRVVTVAPAPPGNLSGTVEFDVPTPLPGVWGPVDIRVELPSGATGNATTVTLYTVIENGYSYRRASGDPLAYGVVPRTVVDSEPTGIRVLGANFTGMLTPAGANNASGVYTRVWLDPDDTTEIGTGSQDEIDLSAATAGVSNYVINSVYEIAFTLDMDELDPTNSIPRDQPVDILLDQYDGRTGTPLTATPTRLIDAVIFRDGTPAPRITIVNPAEAPVSGFNALTSTNFETVITGFDFGPANPIVRIGGVEAEIVAGGYTPAGVGVENTIRVDVPPAPNGLPGVYDVTVIRTDAEQAQGVAHDAFTYYMDGKPVITSIEPNHAFFDPANPDQPEVTYATIRGYNFDDIVDVTFAGATDPDDTRRFYSVSPTEIVITLPDFEPLVQPGDFGGDDVAPLTVTVRNATDEAVADPEAVNLVSDPADFFVYRDTRGTVTPGTPVLEFNDVYFNVPDYENVHPGTGSISVDPMLDTGGNPPTPGPKDVVPQAGGWWLGKLLARDTFTDNPIRDKAGQFSELPYTSFDLENDRRPDDANGTNNQGTGEVGAEGLPDIGADELSEDLGDDPSWFFSRTTPNPVGRLDAGELTVEIGVTGCDGTIAAYIIPQGVDPSIDPQDALWNEDAVIRLGEAVSVGGGYFLFRNRDPITTVLLDNSPTGIDNGDVIADGHAVIALATDCAGSISNLGFNFVDITDSGRIRAQAVYGRHFLIDTIPPHIALDVVRYGDDIPDESGVLPEITANELVVNNSLGSLNDLETAQEASTDLEWHPFTLPALPGWTPAFDDAPVDYDGQIVRPKYEGINGSHIFINTGSYSNNYGTNPPGTNLDLPVRVMFYDPPVTDATETPLVAPDFFIDPFNDAPRQVAGFMVGGQPEPDQTGEGVDTFLESGEAQWILGSGRSLLSGIPDSQAQASFLPGNTGAPSTQGVFVPSMFPDDSVPNPQVAGPGSSDFLTADWYITDIPAVAALMDEFHVAARFEAFDLAGNHTLQYQNTTGLDSTWLLDPLHIWWLVNVQSVISPSSIEGAVTDRATLRMNIPTLTGAQGGPPHIYMYRIYEGSPDRDTGYGDTYSPVGTWSPWSNANIIPNIRELIGVDKWVLVVSIGADEAGNVEPWWKTTNFAAQDDDSTIDLSLVNGTFVLSDQVASWGNWRRFYLSDAKPPDTVAKPLFWHERNGTPGYQSDADRSYGQNVLIPLPAKPDADAGARVFAQFEVSTLAPAGSSTANLSIFWEFLADGVLVAQDVAPASTAIFRSPAAALPVIQVDAPDGFLGDLLNRQRPITYVFRATAFVDDDTDGTVDPGELQDQTPANVYFVVVPTEVGQFVNPPMDPNAQPFKEQEIQVR